MKKFLIILVSFLVGYSYQTIPTSSFHRVTSVHDSTFVPVPVNINADTQRILYKVGEDSIHFKIYNPKDSSGLVYFNLHDDENTAVLAADSFTRVVGGKVIELQAIGERWVSGKLNGKRFWFDPNRIFTDLGIQLTLQMYRSFSQSNRKELKRLSEYITDSLLQGADLVVAIHNNRNGYSILKYMPDSLYMLDADSVHINPVFSPHDFFYVIDENDYSIIKSCGYNVVLQSKSKVANDGSLSIFCAQKGVRYINVEAMEGHFLEQLQMLEMLYYQVGKFASKAKDSP